MYVLTEAANKIFNNEKKKIIVETEQNEKIVATEQNVVTEQTVALTETKFYEKVKIKDKLIDNYINSSIFWLILEKDESRKYNFVNHFINTSTQYDQHADLKNNTFDEKQGKSIPNQVSAREKKLPLSTLKKNNRQM